MPVATVTQFEAGSVDNLLDNELGYAELESGNSTTATIRKPSSSVEIIISGTGFSYDNTPTYDNGEEVTGGTVNQIEFHDNSGLVLRISGLSISAVALGDALGDIQTSGDYTAFDALLAPYTMNYDGTAVPYAAQVDVGGTDGNDTYVLGDGDYFIAPGDGDDTINAGNSSSWTQIDYANESGGGITVNWSAGTVTDPYGNTDTFTGRVNAFRGTSSADNVTGDENNNALRGLAGDDVFDGGGGFDEMRYDRDANYGGMNGVTVNLATGVATDGFGDTDTLINIERVRGTDFADTLTGNSSDNRLRGEGGDDILSGGAGNDEFEGGSGNDTINTGSGENYIRGAAGNDIINVDTSTSLTVEYNDLSSGILFDINATGATVNKGANGTDTINGLDNLDFEIGGFSFRGGSAGDTFNINTASNQWTGISGLGGNDTINNLGDGFVRADYRSDGQSNGSGITYTSNNGSRVSGTVTGAGTGTDTLVDVNEIRGTDYDDVFNGGNGDERFIMRGGNDTVNGGGGTDTIRFDRSGMGAVTVNLTNGVATGSFDGNAFSHTLSGIEIVRGSIDHNDEITGSDSDETFWGKGGNDTLSGLAGNDMLFGEDGDDDISGGADEDTLDGGDGNDTLTGNRGNDTLLGGAGDDMLDGGNDTDTASYANAAGGVSVDIRWSGRNVGGGEGRDSFNSIENLIGSDFGDRLSGDVGDNVLDGGSGNDVLRGQGGNDTLFGGDGNDNLRSHDGVDSLDGGAGNDTLIALGGNDTLSGGSGEDYLYGGQGNDELFGNEDDDRLRGNRGNDEMDGGNGNDDLRGGGNNDTINGGAGNDFILGENGADTITGGAGNDVLRGGFGGSTGDGNSDTFVFKNGDESDSIKDFENDRDLLDVSDFSFASFNDLLALAEDRPSGLRIDFGDGDVLFIDNMFLANFDAGDVIL
ncbi:calcium-binding protein [Roseibium sp. SCP14]|uniref:calcium-binding protein n=1 Tax=Roseibium sp. SCP14 TaxID=3141375 RepID=UPI0033387ECC